MRVGAPRRLYERPAIPRAAPLHHFFTPASGKADGGCDPNDIHFSFIREEESHFSTTQPFSGMKCAETLRELSCTVDSSSSRCYLLLYTCESKSAVVLGLTSPPPQFECACDHAPGQVSQLVVFVVVACAILGLVPGTFSVQDSSIIAYTAVPRATSYRIDSTSVPLGISYRKVKTLCYKAVAAALLLLIQASQHYSLHHTCSYIALMIRMSITRTGRVYQVPPGSLSPGRYFCIFSSYVRPSRTFAR